MVSISDPLTRLLGASTLSNQAALAPGVLTTATLAPSGWYHRSIINICTIMKFQRLFSVSLTEAIKLVNKAGGVGSADPAAAGPMSAADLKIK